MGVERDKACQEEQWHKVVFRQKALESAAELKHRAKERDLDETTSRVAVERAAKEAGDLNRDKEKNIKLQAKRLETQAFLFEQMRRKKEVDEKVKEEKKSLSAALEADALHFADLEVSRTSAQKQRAQEHRAELDRQIASK